MSPELLGVLAAVFVVASLSAAFNARTILFNIRIRHRLSNIRGDDRRISTHRMVTPSISDGAVFLAVAVLGIVVTIAVGVVPALVVVGAGLVAYKSTDIFFRQRADQRYEKDLPMALDAMARSLRSGAGTLDALREAAGVVRGPLAVDLKHIARDVDLGRGIVEAFDGWAERRPAESVRMFSGGMSLALETGGAQAHVVDSVGEALRQSLNATEAAKAAATESKASAFALTVMPLLVSVPVLMGSSSARAFTFHSALGSLLLFVGLGLNALGAFLMMALIKRATA